METAYASRIDLSPNAIIEMITMELKNNVELGKNKMLQ